MVLLLSLTSILKQLQQWTAAMALPSDCEDRNNSRRELRQFRHTATDRQQTYGRIRRERRRKAGDAFAAADTWRVYSFVKRT